MTGMIAATIAAAPTLLAGGCGYSGSQSVVALNGTIGARAARNA